MYQNKNDGSREKNQNLGRRTNGIMEYNIMHWKKHVRRIEDKRLSKAPLQYKPKKKC